MSDVYRKRQTMKADREWGASRRKQAASQEAFLKAVNKAKGRGARVYRKPVKKTAIQRVMHHYSKMGKKAKKNVGPATDYQMLIAKKAAPAKHKKNPLAGSKPGPGRSQESKQTTDRNRYEREGGIERTRGYRSQ